MSKDKDSCEAELPLIAGIDLGGTQIRVAIMQGMKMHARIATLTGEQTTPERVLPRIYATLEQALQEAGIPLTEIAGIGVSCPGPLDNRTGLVHSPPNLAAWLDVPLQTMLQEKYQKPVYVENDANTAALGEYLFGAGQGSRDIVYLTISTGIGAGVIANGRLLEGVNGSAAELGHMTIDWRGERCACGNLGCLEALASGTAIARQANQAIAAGNGAALLKFAQGLSEDLSMQATRGKVTAKTVVEAAEADIPLARAIIARAAEAIGVGVVNILHIFSPEIVILGGGVLQNDALFLEPILNIVQQRTMRANLADARIVLAALGADAGLIGAGSLPAYYQLQI
jgi:glucokinase